MALKIDLFRPVEEFKAGMDTLVRRIKGAPKTPDRDRIYIHGEKELEHAERCVTKGVPVIASVVDALKEAGDQVGVPFDLIPLGEEGTEG